MNSLARSRRGGEPVVDYVWILDSDVIIIRPDAVNAALGALKAFRAAVAGPVRFDVP